MKTVRIAVITMIVKVAMIVEDSSSPPACHQAGSIVVMGLQYCMSSRLWFKGQAGIAGCTV